MKLSDFYHMCSRLAQRIDAHRAELHDILGDYQTYEVVEHEIVASIEALRNVASEYDGFEDPGIKQIASCYMPVNMPLYSLILYGIIPSYYFETIYIRPGMALSKYVPAIVEALALPALGFKHVIIKDLPAKLFTELFAKDSDIILFTGKYENAVMLERECPEALLIFEGTGPCPFFVFENGDAGLAAEKAVAMRCFNSGQDCVAPDVIFVHESQLTVFTQHLTTLLNDVIVGNTRDPKVRIAQAIKEKYLLTIQAWLEKNRQLIQYGGEIDTKELIIHPTVLVKDASKHRGSFKELFSPIFYILSYADATQLTDILQAETFRERSMYACLFGNDPIITEQLALCTKLENMTVNDQENGNQPYGGYGSIANFVSYKGERQARPLLISRDVRDWMLLKQRSHFANQALQVA